MPQVMQSGHGIGQPGAGQEEGAPKPPPGFSHAAAEFARPVRSTQNHCPFDVKFMCACTETQYLPGPRTAGAVSVTWKTPELFTQGWGVALLTGVPGGVAEFR